MQALVRVIRHALVILGLLIAFAVGGPATAAPYAAMVIDARNGEVLFARNHDTKLHPASLTKMMTLYVAFEAVKHGELTLDTMITVSKRAASTECVCLGLRAGQRISLRHLIRAAALRSANDAAVAIAEGISGSVDEFAQRMTRTARAMGMKNTTFRNPHGLTQSGHVSTARDMTTLGRQLFFDYPQYYNIFSRRSDDAGIATVPNTNRRFLDSYSGADGIKTGYTRAAGFNLTASARRGSKHIIATMFGGTSASARNAHVAELMDMGFARAKTRVASRAPATPSYRGRGQASVAVAEVDMGGSPDRPATAKTIRLQTAVRTSPRPKPRPDRTDPAALLAVVTESVDAAVAEIAKAHVAAPPVAEIAAVAPPPRPDNLRDLPEAEVPAPVDLELAQMAGFSVAAPEDLAALDSPAADSAALSDTPVAQADVVPSDLSPAPVDSVASVPVQADRDGAGPVDTAQAALPEAPAPADVAAAATQAPAIVPADTLWSGAADSVTLTAALPKVEPIAEGVSLTAHVDLDYRPADQTDGNAAAQRPAGAIILTRAPAPTEEAGAKDTPEPNLLATAHVAQAHATSGLEVVSRLSTSDAGRLWGVSLGEFTSRSAAERGLITVKMAEASTLGNGVSRIRQTGGRFEATFAGLTVAEAERACLRLQARGMDCTVSHP